MAEALRKKNLKPAFSWLDVWKAEHHFSFTVAKAMELDILRGIHDAVAEAMEGGETFHTFQKRLKPILRKKGWWGFKKMTDPQTGEVIRARLGTPRRLKRIFETNMRTARAAGQWDRIERTQKLRPYLLYKLGPSRIHRIQHWEWKDLLLPADDPFWDIYFPPNDWGCKCWVRQVGKAEHGRLTENDDVRTEAPETEYVDWQNPRTGETIMVPRGVGPGWDMNPGKDRAGAMKKHLERKKKAAPDPLKGEYDRLISDSPK